LEFPDLKSVKVIFLRRFLPLLLLFAPAFAATVEEGLQRFQAGEYRQAHEIWLELAQAGDARAAFYLSQLYAQGKGVKPDLREAMHYLVSAAEQGDSLAQFKLGNHYHLGKWIAQDMAMAEKWWLAAAAQGLRDAQHNLGTLYMKGLGGRQDLPLAWYWLDRATRNGSTAASNFLPQLENPLVATLPAPVSVQSDTPSGQVPPPSRKVAAEKPAAPVQVESAPGQPGVRQGNALGRAWVLRQPADSYTLQLIASTSADAVAHLRDEYKWRRQIAIYRFSNKGQQFTVMVYGRFPDLESARAAIDELPARLRRVPPWPRRFADIQRLIR
jgi:hypothetical protein